jgi:HEAT repeat protein
MPRLRFGLCLSCLLCAVVARALPGQAAESALDNAFAGLTAYEDGGATAPLAAIADAVAASRDQPAGRAEIGRRLADVLETAASTEARVFALGQLTVIGDPALLAEIAPYLVSEELGQAALRAVAATPGPGATEALLWALDALPLARAVPVVEALAARHGETSRDHAALEALVDRLDADEQALAIAAARALGAFRLGPHGVMVERALWDARDDAPPTVRTAICHALLDHAEALALASSVGRASLPIFERLWNEETDDGVRARALTGRIIGMGELGLRPLIDHLDDENPALRHAALSVVARGAMRGTAVRVVAAELPRLEPQPMIELMAALAESGDPAAIDMIATQIEHERTDVRRAALEALVRIGRAKALSMVVDMAQGSDAHQRAAALEALAAVAGPDELPTMIELITDAPTNARRTAAAEALRTALTRPENAAAARPMLHETLDATSARVQPILTELLSGLDTPAD